MKIISFNVNGIRALSSKGLLDPLLALGADVVCLQETKATPEQVQACLLGTAPNIYANSAQRPGYSGTSIASKIAPLEVQFGIGIPEHDTEGRVITATYSTFHLVTAYVPNSGSELARLGYRQAWDKALLTYLKNLEQTKPVVFCGDLNVAHRPIDIKNAAANYNRSAGYMQEEIDGFDNVVNAGFIDTFRALHPTEIKYSWWSYRMGARARNIGWRIDYVLISEVLRPKLREAFILNDIMGSDHCPVGIEIDL